MISYPSVGHDFCFDAEERSFWFAHRNRIILAAVARHPPEGIILDVGAGNGYVAAALQEHWPTIAIEPGAVGAAHARARGVREVICASIEDAGVRGAGGIGLFDVVEHIEDDAGFLQSLLPFLGANGRLYITVPAYRALWSSEDRFAGHFRRYSLRGIRDVCCSAGFRIEYATYFFALLPPAILVARVLPERLHLAKPRTTPSSVRQHDLGGSAARRLAETIFRPELWAVRRGRTIPFGASCLVVARA